MKENRMFLLIVCVSLIMQMQNISFATSASWSVRYVKGATTSSNKTSDTVVYAISTATTKINESCLYATNVADSNGFVGYVTYTGKYMDDNGVFHYNIYSQKAHYSTQSSHNITVSTIPAYSMIYGMYVLHYYDNSAIFNGTYGA